MIIIIVLVAILLIYVFRKSYKEAKYQNYLYPPGTGCNSEDNSRALRLVYSTEFPPYLFEKRAARNGTSIAQERAFEICRIMEKENRVINYMLLKDRCEMAYPDSTFNPFEKKQK